MKVFSNLKTVVLCIIVLTVIGVVEYFLSKRPLSLLIIYFSIPPVAITIAALFIDESNGDSFFNLVLIIFIALAIGIFIGYEPLMIDLKRIFMINFSGEEEYSGTGYYRKSLSYNSDGMLEGIITITTFLSLFSVPASTLIIMKIVGKYFYKVDKDGRPYKSS